MPTNTQRAIAILDAVINTSSTAGQRSAALAAFGALLPAGATTDQIAREFVQAIRRIVLSQIMEHSGDAAALTSKTATRAQVTTDFAEAP